MNMILFDIEQHTSQVQNCTWNETLQRKWHKFWTFAVVLFMLVILNTTIRNYNWKFTQAKTRIFLFKQSHQIFKSCWSRY